MVTELQKTRRRSEKEARASTTDAEARVMKMADGGFRPAYNVCMATAGSPLGGPRTIVGVQVTNVGSDMGMITPMLAEIERRTGQLPKTLLADANHAAHGCIRAAATAGVEALIAVAKRSQHAGAQAELDPAVVAWRERMTNRRGEGGLAGARELVRAHKRAPAQPPRRRAVPRSRARQSNLRRLARGDPLEGLAARRDPARVARVDLVVDDDLDPTLDGDGDVGPRRRQPGARTNVGARLQDPLSDTS